ncbi:hypothetical protein LMG27952_01084 [Paraburkholderia hiiakae]|uniref:Immunity protein 50 of polymorphic toxin system n=1 Tax=Paraburkholderia hiiakae TaxID=1081782 RepID=A0ABM8NDT3_9BURK|nr:hypothetical protein [Paraburkholderia hiiakae]CAD6518947.1 hypothetical protein LMG27952_01084 [Paraburkholderia hiiakae]
MDKLKEFEYFHDWNLEVIATRDRHKLIVVLECGGQRAALSFNKTSRCTIEHFGVANNIVFEVKVLKSGDANYDLALSMLSKSERFSKIPGRQIAMIVATAGAELAVEFDSIEITLESPNVG